MKRMGPSYVHYTQLDCTGSENRRLSSYCGTSDVTCRYLYPITYRANKQDTGIILSHTPCHLLGLETRVSVHGIPTFHFVVFPTDNLAWSHPVISFRPPIPRWLVARGKRRGIEADRGIRFPLTCQGRVVCFTSCRGLQRRRSEDLVLPCPVAFEK